jgi:hypothetical protein
VIARIEEEAGPVPAVTVIQARAAELLHPGQTEKDDVALSLDRLAVIAGWARLLTELGADVSVGSLDAPTGEAVPVRRAGGAEGARREGSVLDGIRVGNRDVGGIYRSIGTRDHDVPEHRNLRLVDVSVDGAHGDSIQRVRRTGPKKGDGRGRDHEIA